MAADLDLVIVQGDTFSTALRWETEPFVYRPITNIVNNGAPTITAPTHGAPNGWRVGVVGVQGMVEINAAHEPLWSSDLYPATVSDGNTVVLNTLVSADFSLYTSGGFLVYMTPQDLTGYTARMSIKDKIGGTLLLSLTTSNGRIALDNTLKTITLTITAVDTAALTWTKGFYDLELVSATGVVTKLISGEIAVTLEVTT